MRSDLALGVQQLQNAANNALASLIGKQPDLEISFAFFTSSCPDPDHANKSNFQEQLLELADQTQSSLSGAFGKDPIFLPDFEPILGRQSLNLKYQPPVYSENANEPWSAFEVQLKVKIGGSIKLRNETFQEIKIDERLGDLVIDLSD